MRLCVQQLRAPLPCLTSFMDRFGRADGAVIITGLIFVGESTKNMSATQKTARRDSMSAHTNDSQRPKSVYVRSHPVHMCSGVSHRDAVCVLPLARVQYSSISVRCSTFSMAGLWGLLAALQSVVGGLGL